MERLTLNRAWTLCLRQWGHVTKRLEVDDSLDVEGLKREWMGANGFSFEDVESNCFFCEYNEQQRGLGCANCPGKLVSKSFNCGRKTYHYYHRPHKFYAKIIHLNKKRKAK